MKKITFILVVLISLTVFIVKADTTADPTYTILPANLNGGIHYVMYDCAAGKIIQALPEVDQTFTLAVDVTGSTLMYFLNDWTLSSPGTDKSIALHLWAKDDQSKNCDVRLMHISGNIYGAKINLKYLVGNGNGETTAFPEDFLASYKTPGKVFYFDAAVFGFGYNTNTNVINIDWWDESAHGPGGFGLIHVATAPYTGAYASDPVFNGNSNPAYIFTGTWGYTAGLAAPCSEFSTGITPATVDPDSPIVAHEYYNLQGVKLPKEPESGLFIDKAIKANGTSVVTKILK